MPFKNSQKKYYFLFLLIISLDTFYTFYQQYNLNLDGDLAAIVVPSNSYLKVLSNPLGLNILTKPEYYPGTNRYFAHKSTFLFLRNAPQFFQSFVDKVNSIFLTIALLKTIVQLLFLYLLSVIITNSLHPFSIKNISVICILFPLFQGIDLNSRMAIIQEAFTYFMFYSVPLLFVLGFSSPFLIALIHNQKINLNLAQKTLLILSTLGLVLGGPLPAGILITTCLVYILKVLTEYQIYKKPLPKIQFIHYLIFWLIFCSLYSIYIGRFNSEASYGITKTLLQRFLILFKGIYIQFFTKLDFFLLFVLNLFNFYLLKRNNLNQFKNIYRYTLIFSILYTFLLPFGGYRYYRPYIIRADTYGPIILLQMLIYGLSTYTLLAKLKVNKMAYFLLIVTFSLYLTFNDCSNFPDNKNEKNNLTLISHSKESKVILKTKSRLISWSDSPPSLETVELNSQLFKILGLTNQKKTYCFK